MRSELQNTKEQLRSAVNRAPMISVPVDFSAVSADGVSSGDEGLLLQQGPDPRPAVVSSISDLLSIKPKKQVTIDECNETVLQPPPTLLAQPSTQKDESPLRRIAISAESDEDSETEDKMDISMGSPATQSVQLTPSGPEPANGLRRIAITEDDEEEEKDEPARPAVTPPAPATKKAKSEIDIAMSTTPVNPTKKAEAVSSSSASKKVKEVTPKKKSASAAAAPSAKKYTSYELERELLQSRFELPALKAILSNIKLSTVASILSGLMEPSVLFLLLKALHTYYSSTAQHAKVLAYFEKIAGSGSFGLVYSLLSADEKFAVQGYARDSAQKAGGDGAEKAEEVLRLYGCQ